MDTFRIKLEKLLPNYQELARYALWFVAAGALLVSVSLSQVFDLIPCTFCWWERVLMFPLAFIATVGILRKDNNFVYYILPMSLFGIVVSLYHSLLQWGIIKESVLDCSLTGAVSCAKPEIMWLGFITIPFMVFVCFTAISILGWLALPKKNSK